MESSEHSPTSVMTGFTEIVQRKMPPPLPPRLFCSGRYDCHCKPSSSTDFPSQADCISVVSVPVLPHSVPVQRKPFASLRKWIPRRRRTTSRGYDNLASTIKRSSQDHYREIYRPRKSSMFDAPSVSSIALPYPSKKPSLRRKLQKFMFCGSR
ncbi:unnamed protein product [Heligmosomoides polygyrus]|uniref:Expressed conserved protein n=1 Tax=Heligmosomoides polygyrus TaxID=6339 RepID=A0A183GN50_HELPZ|nr:unnamed protein product [Heligmosomoides polygyrus]